MPLGKETSNHSLVDWGLAYRQVPVVHERRRERDRSRVAEPLRGEDLG
jgi:hypothetical protein